MGKKKTNEKGIKFNTNKKGRNRKEIERGNGKKERKSKIYKITIPQLYIYIYYHHHLLKQLTN